MNYRAGTVTLPSGQNTVTVTWTTALPSTNYRVALTFTNTPNFGSSSGWGYVMAGSKTTTQFVIGLKDSDGTTHSAPSGGVVFDWIAIADNNP